jgi:hypothetical protein
MTLARAAGTAAAIREAADLSVSNSLVR